MAKTIPTGRRIGLWRDAYGRTSRCADCGTLLERWTSPGIQPYTIRCGCWNVAKAK